MLRLFDNIMTFSTNVRGGLNWLKASSVEWLGASTALTAERKLIAGENRPRPSVYAGLKPSGTTPHPGDDFKSFM
jgi:hypothetical protein